MTVLRFDVLANAWLMPDGMWVRTGKVRLLDFKYVYRFVPYPPLALDFKF